jgi:DNA replication protein DnaC
MERWEARRVEAVAATTSTPAATSKALEIKTEHARCKCGATTEVRVIGNLRTSAECAECRQEVVRAEEVSTETLKLRERVAHAATHMPVLLRQAGIDPDVHGHCRLETFDPNPDVTALSHTRRFCDDMLHGERPNLFLFSKRPGQNVAPGNGKTHLLVSTAARLFEQGALDPTQVLFIRETQMTLEFRRLCNGGRPEDFLAKLVRVPLLLLDDVGKAKTDTPWMRELVFELFAGRESRATAISSNYSLDELVDRDETFASVASRILSKGYFTELHGPDRRPEGRRA